MADVFVSYKAEDRARVAPLVRALESDGVSVWWDAHIGAGDEWRETILRNLESARAVIVVWSRRSVGPQGQFVRDEASRAVKRKTYLPVRIDKVDPPLGFGETQAHDLAGWKGDPADLRYDAVLSALRERFKIKAKRTRIQPDSPAGVSRRGLVASGAAAVILAGGAGTWFALRPSKAKADSIAVLPFENLSGDPSQSYFSDGIAEELRTALARIPGLKVVARTSSEAVRNTDAETAAAKLHVSDILTGSVRRSTQMFRISAQLIDGKEGTERWSEVYDRPIGDSLQIQSDIANRVANALRIRVGSADAGFRERGGTDNPEAQDLLLRAEAARQSGDSESALRESLRLTEAALLQDPKYGDAMTRKCGLLGDIGGTYTKSAADAQSLIRQAEQAGEKAVSLSPLSPAAHVALGTVYFWTFRFSAALQQFEKVQSLEGAKASDLALVGWFLGQLRRFDEALNFVNQGVALDPLNSDVHLERANVLQWMNRLPEADEAAQRAISLSPGSWGPRNLRAAILAQMGRLADAQRENAKIPDGQFFVATSLEAIIAERLGDHAASNRILLKIRNSGFASSAHYQLAQIYAQQHRSDEAIGELQQAWETKDPGLAALKVDYFVDPLRSDPRFQAIVKRVNFPA